MQRNIEELADNEFDLLVIGGGIYGACVTRDAALRGLKVAMIERGDFGSETSHNSLRLIHGGLRYLQHFDIPRIRQSIREQNYWLWAAPHLVRPLKFLMPTYGLGTRGPVALWGATKVYAGIAFDRNKALPAEDALPHGGLVGRNSLLDAIPGLEDDGINGGAYWYDAQVQDPDRLTIELLQDAADLGAVIANYVEADRLVRVDDTVSGASCTDHATGATFDIRARLTACATGPWTASLTAEVIGKPSVAQAPLSKGLNLVTRRLDHDAAFGVRSRRKSDAVIGSSRRMFFATPSARCTIIGTSHLPFNDAPDRCQFSAEDAENFLQEFVDAYPACELEPDDILYRHGGLTPAENDDGSEVARSRQAELIDHRKADGVSGLLSVIGVKYTTARHVAEKAVDLACGHLGMADNRCSVRKRKLPNAAPWKPDSPLQHYGSLAKQIVGNADGQDATDEDLVFSASCRHALNQEMAQTIEDLVLRRTPNAREGALTRAQFAAANELIAEHFGWDDETRRAASERAVAALGARGARIS